MPRFYLTTAIDYVNSAPHLGTAYEKITADVIARYRRGAGYDTHFLMGADEHSLNVRRKAEEEGLDPLDYCARMEDVFRGVWAKLDVSYDEFIRTTERRHQLGVQKLLEAIRAKGDIYEGIYEGWYCVSCEAFKQEKDLEDGFCPLHRAKPDWISEKNHFFRLSAYRDALLELYRDTARLHRAGDPAERADERPGGGVARPLGEPAGDRVGHPRAVRRAQRGVRVVRRARELPLDDGIRHR